MACGLRWKTLSSEEDSPMASLQPVLRFTLFLPIGSLHSVICVDALAFSLSFAAFALFCHDLVVPATASDAPVLQRNLVEGLCVCHVLLVIL